MNYAKKNNQPFVGGKEGAVPFKAWQYIPPFKTMHEYTRSQNLGQTFNGMEKYKTMTTDGHTTGQGYAFEDLFMKAQEEDGHVMEKVATIKNGADFIDNGEPVQLKYSKDGWRIARSLYEYKGEDDAYGTYRYPGQKIVVPKNKGKFVEWHARNRERNGFADNPKSVKESTISCDVVNSYFKKGKESFMMDIKDQHLAKPAIIGGFVVGGSSYLVAKQKILANCKKKGKEMTWKQELLAACIGFLSAGASAASFLLLGCAARQDLRPMKA